MQSDARSDVPGMFMAAHVEVAGAQVDSFVAMDKEYSGVLRLGQTTPSMDSETEPDLERPWQHLDDAQLAAAAAALEGDILQLPPMYSAIKIKGAPPGRLRSALAAHVSRTFWLACEPTAKHKGTGKRHLVSHPNIVLALHQACDDQFNFTKCTSAMAQRARLQAAQ